MLEFIIVGDSASYYLPERNVKHGKCWLALHHQLWPLPSCIKCDTLRRYWWRCGMMVVVVSVQRGIRPVERINYCVASRAVKRTSNGGGGGSSDGDDGGWWWCWEVVFLWTPSPSFCLPNAMLTKVRHILRDVLKPPSKIVKTMELGNTEADTEFHSLPEKGMND